jgi:hypothetical protein
MVGLGGERVLRVREMQGCPGEPYAALSYCWGGDQPVKSTLALISKWRMGIPWERLPKTLQDALIVCQMLGIRFLWVDAFCIVQDDPHDKSVEIGQMPNIYRNSTVTIAASRASSVVEGFLGDRTATNFPDQVFELPYQCQNGQLGSITLIRTHIEPEPLDVRGWTLQERLLSPRTLEFGTRQLRWICQKSNQGISDGWRQAAEHNETRKDNLDDIEVLQAQFDTLQGIQHKMQGRELGKAMENWYRLVRVYTSRSLTVPTDRILAISGIAERYGQAFGDQYCAGIWRATLSSALLWKTHGENMQPRPQKW